MFLRLWDLAKGIAHHSASGAIDRERHAFFIASSFMLGVAALSAAPLYFALVGAPAGIEAVALLFALTPLAAMLAASRTGDLVGAAALGVAGLVGFVLCASFASPGVASAAAALLVAAPLQAALAGSIPLVAAATAAALAAAFVCVSAAAGHAAPPVPSALFILAAIAHAGALSAGLLRLHALRNNSSDAARGDFEALANAIPHLVMQMDRSGAVLSGPQASTRVLGLGVRDLAGRALFERVHVGDRPLFLKTVSDAATGEGAFEADMRLRGGETDDDAVWFGHVRLRVSRIVEEGAPRLIGILRDMREERAHAEELAAARAEAERSGASKDRFLANISHELRTPLNAIIGFSEILGSDMMPVDPARRVEYANIINSSGQHLLQVVNSILDISKIEAGSFQITPDHFDLAPLVAQCCDMVRLKAEENGVELVRETAPDLPEIVADKRAVKQILINLVSNAVKFSRSGGRVSMRTRLSGTGVEIQIEDNGIGVMAHDLSRLGDPFFQAKDSYDRPYEGTGLGLSVVRGLVGLHGGAMRIESAPGEGTRVTVNLPLDCRVLSDPARGRVARIDTIPAGPFAGLSSDQRVKQIA